MSFNRPCPFGRIKCVTTLKPKSPDIVRICQAPIECDVYTPYLEYAKLAKVLGTLDAVKASCPFCECGCCLCGSDYIPRDAERASSRRRDMRTFDMRVKTDCMAMRIMYDKS